MLVPIDRLHPDTTPIERALCCANACGRTGTDDGPCAAGDYGRRRREALAAAGYEVTPRAELDRLREILRLGITARHAQNTYFRDRSRDNLVASKLAEKAFDDAARAAIAAEGQGT